MNRKKGNYDVNKEKKSISQQITVSHNLSYHPYDPTVVICYLIWPCDKAVRMTYLISHSSF